MQTESFLRVPAAESVVPDSLDLSDIGKDSKDSFGMTMPDTVLPQIDAEKRYPSSTSRLPSPFGTTLSPITSPALNPKSRIPMETISSHWKHNNKLEFGDEFIYGQANGPTKELKIGDYTDSYNACGIAAAYNSLKLLDNHDKPANIVTFMENENYLRDSPFNSGGWGIKTEGIEKYFSENYDYDVKKTIRPTDYEEDVKVSDVSILKYRYNGLREHYVAVKWNGEQFVVYNEYNTDTEPRSYNSIESLIKDRGRKILDIITIKKREGTS